MAHSHHVKDLVFVGDLEVVEEVVGPFLSPYHLHHDVVLPGEDVQVVLVVVELAVQREVLKVLLRLVEVEANRELGIVDKSADVVWVLLCEMASHFVYPADPCASGYSKSTTFALKRPEFASYAVFVNDSISYSLYHRSKYSSLAEEEKLPTTLLFRL